MLDEGRPFSHPGPWLIFRQFRNWVREWTMVRRPESTQPESTNVQMADNDTKLTS